MSQFFSMKCVLWISSNNEKTNVQSDNAHNHPAKNKAWFPDCSCLEMKRWKIHQLTILSVWLYTWTSFFEIKNHSIKNTKEIISGGAYKIQKIVYWEIVCSVWLQKRVWIELYKYFLVSLKLFPRAHFPSFLVYKMLKRILFFSPW